MKLRGKIKEFDEARGLGVVAAGGVDYPFHCVQIADGSRTIAVGTEVEFDVGAGPPGQWEAVGLHKFNNL